MLRTNIELDEKVVDEAMQLSGKRTKKELVNYALTELVRQLRRRKLLDLEGRVPWTGDLDDLRESRT